MTRIIKVLWYYFSGWGLVALVGSAMIGYFLATVVVGWITKSPEIIRPAGVIGALLSLVADGVYVLHIDKEDQ